MFVTLITKMLSMRVYLTKFLIKTSFLSFFGVREGGGKWVGGGGKWVGGGGGVGGGVVVVYSPCYSVHK